MSTLNWGMISDGGTFESLVQTILYSENNNTLCFGRPGKDSGQDAKSDNGEIVYQAKYYQSMTMCEAIHVAKAELKKMKEYKDPSHSNFKHWESVKEWVLVANFSINPNDHQKWVDEIIPLFKAKDLEAKYWDKTNLESKLAELPHIRDVFFGGENRVLLGLREAHDQLSDVVIGGDSMAYDMVGRLNELERIRSFADSDKKVLAVTGPAGIGKSRLLYEGLVALSDEGWRTFWAQSNSMAKSTQWFHLLNGNQKTCIVIDQPDDPLLLKVLVEQLSSTERRNWKILLGLRTEHTFILKDLYQWKHYEKKSIELNPLSEDDSKALLKLYFGSGATDANLHSICTFTRGAPIWLCLIAELKNKGLITEHLTTADAVIKSYVDSCLNTFDTSLQDDCKIILAWLALWDILKIENGLDAHGEFEFLHGEYSIAPERSKAILEKLKGTGLVKNYGINKRLYRVDSRMVQHFFICSEFFREENGSYQVNDKGTQFVQLLISQKIPNASTVLRTISHSSIYRLQQQETFNFMEPMFDHMEDRVKKADIIVQYHVYEFVKAVGPSDTERALDIIRFIRESPTSDQEMENGFWGKHIYTHPNLTAKLPWLLFELAGYVTEVNIARRYLIELIQYCDQKDPLQMERGKEPSELLKRVLSEKRSAECFIGPAKKWLDENIDRILVSLSVRVILETLMNPIRSSFEETAKWTIGYSKHALMPGSKDWDLAVELRNIIFNKIELVDSSDLRKCLWEIINETHHNIHRPILHQEFPHDIIGPYTELLKKDLVRCRSILNAKSEIPLPEALAAREVWSWYIECGPEDELKDLSRQCEESFKQLGASKWNFDDLFQWGNDNKVDISAQRVVSTLKDAGTIDVIDKFFREAEEYLIAIRKQSLGIANSALFKIALAFREEFDPESEKAPPITEFVIKRLKQHSKHNPNAPDWMFCIFICKNFLLKAKGNTKDHFDEKFTRLCDLTEYKAELIWGLYSNPHPNYNGNDLFPSEVELILKHVDELDDHRKYCIYGIYGICGIEEILNKVEASLKQLSQSNSELVSQCLHNFIQSVATNQIRYENVIKKEFIPWILGLIQKYKLDGSILCEHDLIMLMDRSGFQMTTKEACAFIKARIELEKEFKSQSHWNAFPHGFNFAIWTKLNIDNAEDKEAFYELCYLIFETTFSTIYGLPIYIAQIDVEGESISRFIQHYIEAEPEPSVANLRRLAHFASCHSDESKAWIEIATPLCEKADNLGRKERESIYASLLNRSRGWSRSADEEVPSEFIQRLEQTNMLLENESKDSPLYQYRKWAFNMAEIEVQRERERFEEDHDK